MKVNKDNYKLLCVLLICYTLSRVSTPLLSATFMIRDVTKEELVPRNPSESYKVYLALSLTIGDKTICFILFCHWSEDHAAALMGAQGHL